jgi:hypothetical protein
MTKLNIFYEEPDPDRWFKYDRYVRRIIRRIVRGKPKPGGMMMFALQLMQGLDKINVPYRFNDYRYARAHPEELVCIVGKPEVLLNRKWKNPILFGPAVFSHPAGHEDIFEQHPTLKKIIVSCEWMKQMFLSTYPEDKMQVWSVGIDTYKWNPALKALNPPNDILIYNKIRWEHEYYNQHLLQPLIQKLEASGCTYEQITYGNYTHADLQKKLAESKAVVFLCEHETQGLAYQQILATNTPMLAWDRGGFWQDPYYYPDKVKFGPVSSTPYWDSRCGMKFKDAEEFGGILPEFLDKLHKNEYAPRDYVMEHLSLEGSAAKFVKIVNSNIAGGN